MPSRGKYNIVFDSPSRRKAGKFTFRYWVNDVTPPTVKLRGYSNGIVKLSIGDAGAGVDPSTIQAFLDGSGSQSDVSFGSGIASVRTGSIGAGKHTIKVVVADYQETKNMEDVGPDPPEHPHLHGLLYGLVTLVDRRQAIQVALDARRKVLERLLGADHLEIRLAPCALAPAPRLDARSTSLAWAIPLRPARRRRPRGARSRRRSRAILPTWGFTNSANPFTLRG